MANSTGIIAFIVIVAVLLSCLGAWATAWRYRAAMRRLMSAPAGAVAVGPGFAGGAAAAAPPVPPVRVTLADNRRAAIRLTALLIGISLLIAVSAACLWLVRPVANMPFAWKRAAVLAVW